MLSGNHLIPFLKVTYFLSFQVAVLLFFFDSFVCVCVFIFFPMYFYLFCNFGYVYEAS